LKEAVLLFSSWNGFFRIERLRFYQSLRLAIIACLSYQSFGSLREEHSVGNTANGCV
jgi:hypothetical protein